MSAEYSVNIKLNTAELKTQLSEVDKSIRNLGGRKGKAVPLAMSLDKYGQFKNDINAITKAKQANLSVSKKIDILEIKGVRSAALRQQYAKLNQAQSNRNFGLHKKELDTLNLMIASAEKKLAKERAETQELRKQETIRKRISRDAAKSSIGGSRYQMGSPAQQAYSGGPSSPIQGSKFMKGSPIWKANQSAALQGAMISGAFPLLFGQSPLVAAAGGLGGYAGGKGWIPGLAGGSGASFAAGIAATAAITAIQSAMQAIAELGTAMNALTMNTTAVIKATGNANTFREREIQIMERTQGKQAAHNEALKDMEKVIGDKGVKALKQYGKDTQRLAGEWEIFMLQMKAGLAWLVTVSKVLSGESRQSLKARATADYYSGGGYKDEEVDRLMAEIQRRDAVKGSGPAARYRGGGLAQQKIIEGLEKKLKTRMDYLDTLPEYSDEAKLERQNRYRQNLLRIDNVYKQISLTIKDGIVEALYQTIEGTKTLGEVASSVFRSIAKMLLDYGITTGLGAIFKGSDFGKYIAGTKAEGGPVGAGKSYIVGEKGPELFTPTSSGNITSNSELAGSTSNIVVNVDASGSSVEGDDQGSQQLGEMLAAAIQSELVKQKRPGGILS